LKVTSTALPTVLIFEPDVFNDSRGFFFESFNQRFFAHATGLGVNFVQDNHSRSAKGVLRGLHYQILQPQGKLVRVVSGAVFDVVVDIRKSSGTFGQWIGVELTEENRKQLWIPPGFAHGSLSLTETTDLLYKVTTYQFPEHERCIIWNDQELGISWPLQSKPLLSARDDNGIELIRADLFG
jgi:dTDP-4-dehydrorhamnose 3,5-epimerase